MQGFFGRRAAAQRLTVLAGLAFSSLAAASPTLTTLAGFPSSLDGAGAQGGLLRVGAIVYGTAQYGGAYGYGAVYAYNLTTKSETIVYSFTGGSDGGTPEGGLIAIGSVLYGVTSAGGANALGTVFSISISTQAETVLHSFTGTDGSAPMGALLSLGSKLYGTTSAGGSSHYGTLFSINPASGAITVLHNFAGDAGDGAIPMAALAVDGNTLYGTTQSGGANGQVQNDPYTGGTIFRYDAIAGKYAVVWNFGAGTDGAAPAAPLRVVGSIFYGTTYAGGTAGGGTIFSFPVSTGKETVLHSFDGADGAGPLGGLAYAGGVLYGTTFYGTYLTGPNEGQFANYGTVYSYTIATQKLAVLHSFPLNAGDAEDSQGTPLLDGELLLGTGISGGANGQGGALFEITLPGGAETILHDFTGSSANGGGAVAAGSAALLAASSNAGAAGAGAVLSLDTTNGTSSTLVSLSGGAEGNTIAGPLWQLGSIYYGVTSFGGTGCGRQGCGTLFSLDAATGALTVLYRFTGTKGDGANPTGLTASGSTLFGTTAYGGKTACACGTVFKFDITTKTETVLYAFAGGSDGQTPAGAPVLASGTLWGTTAYGGIGVGTIWKVDSETGAESVAYSFGTNANDGFLPFAGLLLQGSTFYGTTYTGGNNGGGTVFSFVPSTGVETTLAALGAPAGLASTEPSEPEAALAAFDGLLIGTSTYGGSHNVGTVFSVNPKTGATATYWSFTGGLDGGLPAAPVLKFGASLYGVTGTYGAHGTGTLFKLTP